MKVWELMLWQEGCYSYTKIFAEDRPPSNEVTKEFLLEAYRDTRGYKPELTEEHIHMIEDMCKPTDRRGKWEDLTLSLKEVH